MTLRVILQIVPFGDEDKAYEIDRLNISNNGNGLANPDWFDYVTEHKGRYLKGLVRHKRSDGALVLVRKVLEHYGL